MEGAAILSIAGSRGEIERARIGIGTFRVGLPADMSPAVALVRLVRQAGARHARR